MPRSVSFRGIIQNFRQVSENLVTPPPPRPPPRSRLVCLLCGMLFPLKNPGCGPYHFYLSNATYNETKTNYRYVKEAPLFNGRYMNGIPFHSKKAYKRVRVGPCGRTSMYNTRVAERSGMWGIYGMELFSSIISVILILMCGIVVSSSPTVYGFSPFWLTVRSFMVLWYHLFALCCLILVNTNCSTNNSKLKSLIKINILRL